MFKCNASGARNMKNTAMHKQNGNHKSWVKKFIVPCAGSIGGRALDSAAARELLFSKRGGVEAPVAIVHHHNSHLNLAWRPIPQPQQTGSPGGGGGGQGL